ncbi:MAG: UDP-2,3-diacylglucosamine diphosphatase LpxI [Pseudomonadota bacterium]
MRRLAIIAGAGDLPKRIALYCQEHDIDAIILSFHGNTREDIDGFPHFSFAIEKFQPIISCLQAQNITDVVMAGAIKRPSLWALRLDAMALRAVAHALTRGDDHLLRTIANFLESEAGVRVAGIGDYLPAFELPLGSLGCHAPDADAKTDIARANNILKRLAKADVGQAVAVQQGLILGIETIEGTDVMIARAGTLKRDGPGPILVKMPKTGQDRRFDLPTVGVDTIKNCQKAGFQGVCIARRDMVILDHDVLVAQANADDMFLWVQENLS